MKRFGHIIVLLYEGYQGIMMVLMQAPYTLNPKP